jgi:hypothetical protein
MPDLNLARRRIEGLPSDDWQVVDTLSGAILRIFVHLNGLDAAVARLGRRLSDLAGPQPSATRPMPPPPAVTETTSVDVKPASPAEVRGISPFGGVESLPMSKRSRGRPKSPAKPSPKRPRGRPRLHTVGAQPAVGARPHREDLEDWAS